MAEEEAKQKVAEPSDEGALADYLKAPQRKKKTYVAVAFGSTFDPYIRTHILNHVRQKYPKIYMHEVRNRKDIIRFSQRDLALLIIDDEYLELADELTAIEELKRKKGTTPIPVLFLTRRQSELINAYHKTLVSYQEVDDYIHYMKTPLHQVTDKIDKLLQNRERRSGRRFESNIKTDYLLLRENRVMPGRILNISLHGAAIICEAGTLFREKDQLRLHLPVQPYLDPKEGDYIRISAKVQRVFIGGSRAGISFEHVTDRQGYLLTQYVTKLATNSIIKQRAAARRHKQS